jgi:hypothetical protein
MTKSIDRTDRETETREDEDTRLDTWEEAGVLDAKPSANGKRRRWIRAESRGQRDTDNWRTKRTEGWTKVNPKEYPDEFRDDIDDGMDEVIRGGGLVLCELPERKAKARERHFAVKRYDSQMATAEKLKASNDRLVPFLNPDRPASEETTEVRFRT